MSEDGKKKVLMLLVKIAVVLLLVCIVVHTIFVVVTGAGVRKAKEALKAKGYPMTAAEIIPKAIPDEQNAALELKKVFGLMTLGGDETYSPGKASGDLGAEYKKLIDLVSNGEDFQKPFTDEQLEMLAKTFDTKDMEQVFDLLSAAARKPGFYIDHKYEEGPNLLLPELSLYRNVCRILAIRAKYEAQKGNEEGSLQRVREGLLIGNMLKDEPILISQLVRVACLHLSLEPLQFVSSIHELTDQEIKGTVKLAKPYTDVEPILLGMNGERLLFGQWFFEEDKSMDVDRDVLASEAGPLIRVYDWYLFRPFFNADYSSYLNVMRVNTEIVEKDLKTVLAEDTDKLVMDEISGLAILSKMMAPALSKIRMKVASTNAMVQIMEMAIACNQYRHKNGKYPESLDDIGPTPVEEATGEPFVFKKTEKGIIIHSACDQYSGGLEITVDGKEKKVLGVELVAPKSE